MCPRISVHRFSHQAMGTFFEVLISGEDESYAGQAARAAFSEIDRLERLFSRFDPASEIGRANRLKPGEEMAIGIESYECLSLAETAHRETGGAFDVNVRAGNLPAPPFLKGGCGEISTMPPAFEIIKSPTGFILRRPRQDPSVFIGLDLDLGGIGKGYALDRTLEVLKDWSIENTLINGGTSTVLALGSAPPDLLDDMMKDLFPAGEERPRRDFGNDGKATLSIPELSDVSPHLSDVSPHLFGWPVGVGAGWPEAPQRALLSGRALSGSGPEVKGPHILDPRTGLIAQGSLAAWASHPSAALSDAFSTSFLVMTADEVEAFCALRPETWACVVVGYGAVRVFNPNALSGT